MAFGFSDEDNEQYEREGYVIFREIVPASLMNDIRNAIEPVEEFIAHNARVDSRAGKREKPDMRRYGPLSEYEHLMPSLKPIQDFCELPALLDAVQRITSPECNYGTPETLEVLRSPAAIFSTAWHRDFLRTPGESGAPTYQELFDDMAKEPTWFHQFNCPLYRELSLWYVPGTYNKDDTDAQRNFLWRTKKKYGCS